jgi:prepilin peptidase CpaA
MLVLLILVIFCGCMLYAAVNDMLSMTIANRIPVLLAATFPVVAWLAGMDVMTIGLHMAVGVGMLFLTFALFVAGAMGGGDAKLIAATSVWFGLSLALAQYLVWSAMLGGLLTLILIIYRATPLAPAMAHLPAFRHFGDREKGIPYGIALAPAAMMALPGSALGAWALTSLGW